MGVAATVKRAPGSNRCVAGWWWVGLTVGYPPQAATPNLCLDTEPSDATIDSYQCNGTAQREHRRGIPVITTALDVPRTTEVWDRCC